MPFDPNKLSTFPTAAGVYLMKSKEGKILYIGKANNLRNRVRQYFIPGRDGRAIVPFLTAQIETIDTIVVTSEIEALLLENNLIKKHQPKYNASLKDDKTFFSLAINHKHQWPMIRVVRYKGKPPANELYFGPYAKGHAARQTLELLRHLFPMRQCSDFELVRRTRPCILYDFKRCIAPCVNKCTREEYHRLVEQAIHFLKGQDKQVLKELKEEFERAIHNLEFEKAEQINHTLLAIEETLKKQKVDKAGSKDKDALGLFRQADAVVLTQMVYKEGKLLASYDRTFFHNAQNDGELLSSFIIQHYVQQDPLPQEILIPVSLEDGLSLMQILNEGKKRKCEITVPKRGDKLDLVKLAAANAEAKFKQLEKDKNEQERILISLEETLQLINYPARIECFDHSNISGSEPVSVMVVFSRGKPDPKEYRQYRIKSAAASDDYGALKEVLTRRCTRAKEEDDLPDLILIDGGKGHLNLARQVLSDLDISTVDLAAIAKEEGKHARTLTAERIYLASEPDPIQLSPYDPLLFFLQKIRDEAHRFAITFQRKRRGKKSLASAMDTLPGIGPVKKKRLLRHFGSWKRVCDANEEEWLKVKGITKKDVETLQKLKPI